MNSEFPPRQLAGPVVRVRRSDKPRLVPLPPELLARRAEVARILGVQVGGLNKQLKAISPEERKAIFYKVTHNGPVELSGTGLKALVDRSERVTLAIPLQDSLDGFEEKLQQLATDTPKNGMVKNQSLARIEEFASGEPMDRLSDELLANYKQLVQQQFVICEIEITSMARGQKQRRDELAEILTQLRNAFASGVYGTIFDNKIGDRLCRAVIRCTGKMFRQLVEGSEWQRKISWFEPKPEFETFHTIWSEFQFEKLAPIKPPSENAPFICVVDSGVTSGNPFLAPVTKEEMLKSFLTDDESPYDENGHGSGVASLAAFYALNLEEKAENKAKVWIAGARILGPDNQLEQERLFSKVLEEVVDYFVPLGVRIFNLSVGDRAKKWNQDNKRTQPRTSWTARTLDRLSRKHDIVFVVSTGNLLLHQVRDYLKADSPYPVYLCDDESRILDPGQAGLAISVGSIAAGTLVAHTPSTSIALDFEPSPFTRSGPGIKGETKPDLIEFGGNLVQDLEHNVTSNAASNVVMASHQLSPAAARNYGTSFATPRVAHKLAILLQELQELGLNEIGAPLLKAFLINSAKYEGDIANIKQQLDAVENKRWLQVLGYGRPDSARATECDDYSILLFHQGQLETNQTAFFEIPVPSTLANSTNGQRITVTLAHYPEVQKWGLESYFGTDLKWRMFRGDVDQDDILDAMSHEDVNEKREGPERPKDLAFEHKLTRRSRGSVQHDWFDWKTHKEKFSTNHYKLAISANSRWSRKAAPTKFAVVVRIEDLGGTVPIYTEIATEVDFMIAQQSEV